MLGHNPLSNKPLSTLDVIIGAGTNYSLNLSSSSSNSTLISKGASKSLPFVSVTIADTIAGSNKTKGGVNAASGTTASITTVTGRLYIATINALGTGSTCSISDGLGLTWIQVGTTIDDGTNNTIKMFYAICSSGATGTLSTSFAFFGGTWVIDEFTGIDTTNPIVQSVQTSVGDTTSPISLTLSSFGHANNATYACWAANDNSGAITFSPEAGYTALATTQRGGFSNWAVTASEFLSSNETTPSETWSGALTACFGFAVEIKANVSTSGGANVLLPATTITNKTVAFTTTPYATSIGGLSTWTNVGNAITQNGSYARTTVTASGSEDIVYNLADVGIPNNATVTHVDFYTYARSSLLNERIYVMFANNSTSPTYYGWNWYGYFAGGANTWIDFHLTNGIGISTTLENGSGWNLPETQRTGTWWNSGNASINMWIGGIAPGAVVDIDDLDIIVTYTTPLTGSTPQKLVSKLISSSSSNSTSIVRNIAKSLVTSMTNLASIIASFVGGATDYPLLLETTSAASASIIKSVSKLLTTSSSNVTTLIKVINKLLTSSSTSNSSVIRGISKTLLTSSSSIASIIRQVARILSTSSTSIASIIKNVSKTLSTSVTNSAIFVGIKTVVLLLSTSSSNVTSIVREIGKLLSGTSNHTNSIVKVANKLVNTTSSSSSSLLNSIEKRLSTTSTGTAIFNAIKTVVLLLSTTSSNTISFIKDISKSLNVNSIGNSSIVKSISKNLIGTASVITSIIKNVNKLLATSSVGIATLSAIASVIYYLNLVTSSVANTSIIKSISKNLNTSTSLITSLIKNVEKVINVSSLSNSLLLKTVSKVASASASNLSTVAKAIQLELSGASSTAIVTIVSNITALVYNILVLAKNWSKYQVHKFETTVLLASHKATICNIEVPIKNETIVQIDNKKHTISQIINKFFTITKL